MKAKRILTILFLLTTMGLMGQEISSTEIISNSDLHKYLKKEQRIDLLGSETPTASHLAKYFRQVFSERYFYDWKNFEVRFKLYKDLYKDRKASHLRRASEHMERFEAQTKWQLPFNDKTGKPLDTYSFRHLARQHKMLDIAFSYFYQEKDPKFIEYFLKQKSSLNAALTANEFETSSTGNGVYEGLRSGYRILNWLQIHNMFLGETAYSDEEQLNTIATLLQTAAELYESNPEFVPGNHQTRGMSALAMVSILFRDFEDTEKWYHHSMKILEEHLKAEINDDGFQFERSLHYHLSDIENYFYVYQLAMLNKQEVSEIWTNKMNALFTTLTKVAYPDGTAPALQDDTDRPWAERNIISDFMALGYLLFKDPVMGYFADDRLNHELYWFVNKEKLEELKEIKTQKPDIGSVAFHDTGYFIMRDGWEQDSNVMIVTAGLDDKKPDHQHGDMLGVQAWANGKVILPNYLVRYSLDDFQLFKNSMVKNVALVDDELQGKIWTPNKGRTGFGKFGRLPHPKVLVWNSTEEMDLFVGTHNGFEDIDTQYSRQVIFLKKNFWIIKDNFKSEEKRDFRQVWQGHYTMEQAPNHILSSFENGSGCSIFQLNSVDSIDTQGKRGKEWTIMTKNNVDEFEFVTIILPFDSYLNVIGQSEGKTYFGDWVLNVSPWSTVGPDSVSITNGPKHFFFSVDSISKGNIQIKFSERADVYLEQKENQLKIKSLVANQMTAEISYRNSKKKEMAPIMPGEMVTIKLD
ncbi:heparinase II/III family protein [Flagellimonas nanhaiensis]|uniref:Heparinase n=1 Tax=Flagellimonas nanhaiensis TaxID=2292706 RepID=A0A371JRS3_9FLAO|nr:heparinase II/III family protein [Allomuricauda nanhaiensis]RDY60197.1 heparinase [Allomuricauda nanhaiensis]